MKPIVCEYPYSKIFMYLYDKIDCNNKNISLKIFQVFQALIIVIYNDKLVINIFCFRSQASK